MNLTGLHMAGRVLVLMILLRGLASAQLDFEREPIKYSETRPTDAVQQLADRLSDSRVELKWESHFGFLRSLLTQLEIPVSSQTLVFSKTSLQVSRISPRTPRAVYFNDEIYVGWVQNGDLIEISAADPKLGATFYSISQKKSSAPQIRRETSRCLQCHGSTHTRRIPGHIVRSVIPDKSGQPVFRLGTHITDHTSAFAERFGGWYVTGTHGSQQHLGNEWLDDPDESEELNVDRGANVTDLSDYIDTSKYLADQSDIVALMVMQHQVHMHNVLTAANHSGRLTARDAQIMNKALEREPDFESDSTRRRYDSAAERVVRALLFCDEAQLTSPVVGSSEFAVEFARQGPFDTDNRSLREFDLHRRLFRYPCSFLIYSDAFSSLPAGVLERVRHRLHDILLHTDQSSDFGHLSKSDRDSIAAILTATGVTLSASERQNSQAE